MKIDKVIFTADDSHFLDFWPLQAKICKEILNIEPVLFHITEEESDFYNDGNGLVKKVLASTYVQNKGAQAACSRMYFTKYFQNEVCLISDIDLITIDKSYINSQIKNFNEDSLVIFNADGYDLNRPEAINYINQHYFPEKLQLYPYHFNAAKGKIFDKLLGTNCSLDEWLQKHADLSKKFEDKMFWGVDEFYFSKCIKNNIDIKIHKLNRNFTSPWKVPYRIERHELSKESVLEGIIDINLPRPYIEYKDTIEQISNIILNK